MTLTRSKIEWTDYTINPVKGKCPKACPYCYARRMYDRFKWNPKVRFEPAEMLKVATLPPSRIFVGSTMELFGEWVKPEWRETIFDYCRRASWHTFIFLTKCPHHLPPSFPPNCWVGVTATSALTFCGALGGLGRTQASVKFISVEPLLSWEPTATEREYDLWIREAQLQWLIIGQQTPVTPKTQPRIEWIRDIVEACDRAGVKVWLKNNLYDLLAGNLDNPKQNGLSIDCLWANDKATLRQEFPR